MTSQFTLWSDQSSNFWLAHCNTFSRRPKEEEAKIQNWPPFSITSSRRPTTKTTLKYWTVEKDQKVLKKWARSSNFRVAICCHWNARRTKDSRFFTIRTDPVQIQCIIRIESDHRKTARGTEKDSQEQFLTVARIPRVIVYSNLSIAIWSRIRYCGLDHQDRQNVTIWQGVNLLHHPAAFPTVFSANLLTTSYQIIKAFTGHGRFNDYLLKFHLISTPNCFWPTSVETVEHLPYFSIWTLWLYLKC